MTSVTLQKKRLLKSIAKQLSARIKADPELTQSEVARRSGESAMQVSRVVHGQFMASAWSLSRICRACGTTVDEILK